MFARIYACIAKAEAKAEAKAKAKAKARAWVFARVKIWVCCCWSVCARACGDVTKNHSVLVERRRASVFRSQF